MLKKLSALLFHGKFIKVIIFLFDVLCYFAISLLYYFLSGTVDYSTPVKSSPYWQNILVLAAFIFVWRGDGDVHSLK